MRRLLFVLSLLAASSAHAATVTMEVDNPTGPYFVGDTVTLVVTVTADAGEESSAVFGKILFSGDGRLDPYSQSPALLETAGVPWTLGALPCDATSCTLMNQFQATPGPVSNIPLVIMVARFPVSAPGRVIVQWEADSFDFFDAAPSADLCIWIFRGTPNPCVIPEPATGGLLALGLAALATAARRRTR